MKSKLFGRILARTDWTRWTQLGVSFILTVTTNLQIFLSGFLPALLLTAYKGQYSSPVTWYWLAAGLLTRHAKP